MNFTVTMIIITLVFAAAGYVFFKLYRMNKSLYLSEIKKNEELSEEIYRLEEMEKLRNAARKVTEEKIDHVDSCDGIDKFNAINDVLSDNS